MTKLAIIGTAEIAPGRIDEVLPLLMAHRDRCLKDEPGTRQFEVLRVRDDDTKLMLYELYENDAAFQAHWNGPSVARAQMETSGLITKLTGIRCSLQE
jgi:(4S)-4-hydroxy-5-phosphonooxypentane-2,3-dione isomerase